MADVANITISINGTDSTYNLKDVNAVHKTGDETVSGIKTFASNPVVPTPTASGHAATKAYVDSGLSGKQTAVASTSVSASGLVSFLDASSNVLFTLQLPLYSGGVS